MSKEIVILEDYCKKSWPSKQDLVQGDCCSRSLLSKVSDLQRTVYKGFGCTSKVLSNINDVKEINETVV